LPRQCDGTALDPLVALGPDSSHAQLDRRHPACHWEPLDARPLASHSLDALLAPDEDHLLVGAVAEADDGGIGPVPDSSRLR
jgi:hypothetical protein